MKTVRISAKRKMGNWLDTTYWYVHTEINLRRMRGIYAGDTNTAS